MSVEYYKLNAMTYDRGRGWHI